MCSTCAPHHPDGVDDLTKSSSSLHVDSSSAVEAFQLEIKPDVSSHASCTSGLRKWRITCLKPVSSQLACPPGCISGGDHACIILAAAASVQQLDISHSVFFWMISDAALQNGEMKSSCGEDRADRLRTHDPVFRMRTGTWDLLKGRKKFYSANS